MKVSTALMAGGRSRRFGTDKAFATVNGKPLWKAQLEKLVDLTPGEMLLSCRETQNFGLLPGVERVFDEIADQGPLGGLAACLVRASHAKLVVLAVDLPKMTVEFLEEMLELATDDVGVVPRWSGGRWEPLAAVYPVARLQTLAKERLHGGNLALQELLEEASEKKIIREMPIRNRMRELFTNVNTLEEFEKI